MAVSRDFSSFLRTTHWEDGNDSANMSYTTRPSEMRLSRGDSEAPTKPMGFFLSHLLLRSC